MTCGGGYIQVWNAAASRMFGYANADWPHLKLDALLDSSPIQQQDETLVVSLRMEGVRADGSRFPCDVSFGSAAVEGDPCLFFLIRDTTTQEMLKAQLAQAQKLEAIGSLAAGVAHEINTPTQYVNDNMHFLQDSFAALAPVMVAVEALLEEVQAGALPVTPGMEALSQAWKAVDAEFLSTEIPLALQQNLQGLSRIAEIVRSMKALAHPGNTSELASEDLNALLRNAVTLSTGEWKYVADLALELADELPPVPCLPGELTQVFLNLIINAAHAIDAVPERNGKGQITVQSRRSGHGVEVRVSDTGTGIPPAVQPRIFDPFFTTKAVGKGTGQGLAIACTIIVDKHRGELAFETIPGTGTTFIVTLPLGKEGTYD